MAGEDGDLVVGVLEETTTVYKLCVFVGILADVVELVCAEEVGFVTMVCIKITSERLQVEGVQIGSWWRWLCRAALLFDECTASNACANRRKVGVAYGYGVCV